MSAGERSEGRFQAVSPEQPASESDQKFAERFVEIATLVASCRRRGRVSLLLSTCRNQWMTINAAFFDIREVLVARQARDAATEALERLKFAQFKRARSAAGRGIMLLDQARYKFKVWNERESLREEFEDALHALPESFSKERIVRWYEAQKTGRARGVKPSQTKYMEFNLDGDPEANAFFELLIDVENRLRLVLNIVTHAVRLLEGQPEPEAESDEPELKLFEGGFAEEEEEEEEEPDGSTKKTSNGAAGELDADEAAADTWVRLIKLLSAEPSAIGATWEATADGGDLVFTDAAAIALPGSLPPTAQLQAILDDLRLRALATVDDVAKELVTSFHPNVAEKPLPDPYVLDLRPQPVGRHVPSSFKVEHFLGTQEHVPKVARVAMLDVDIPEEAYDHDDNSLYVYDRVHSQAALYACELALAAIDRAKAEGAHLLVLPEVFIPRASREAVFDAARTKEVMLVGGLEYPVRIGRALNEAAIVAAGLGKVVNQRKQRPSVYEIRPNLYEADGRLAVIEQSPIGTFAVVVCSDYLELDLMWKLASQPTRLDVVIVCSRNPQPAPFVRLAEADAVRLHAYVIVVNSVHSRRDERMIGPFICGPNVHAPRVETERHELPTRWSEIGKPALLLADLQLGELRKMDTGRGGGGFLRPPHFPRRKLGGLDEVFEDE